MAGLLNAGKGFDCRQRHKLWQLKLTKQKKGCPALSFSLVTHCQARLRNSLRSNSAWLNRLALA
jgi:hypothetical protein